MRYRKKGAECLLAMVLLYFPHSISMELAKPRVGVDVPETQIAIIEELLNLVRTQKDIQIKDARGLIILHRAAAVRSTEAIELLLEKGANVNVESGFTFMTPIEFAVEGGHIDAVRLLYKAGAKLANELMFIASEKGDVPMIKLLQEFGLDINAVDERGITPTHKAVMFGQTEAMHYFKEQGTKAFGEEVASSLFKVAAIGCDPAGLRCLSQLGVRLPQESPLFTYLSWVLDRSLPVVIEVIRAFKEIGVDLDEKLPEAANNMSALHLLCCAPDMNVDPEVFTCFRDLGANLDVQDRQGLTPLHYLAIKSELELIKKLHELGASLEIQDSEGLTPLFYAETEYAADLFKELGAKTQVFTKKGGNSNYDVSCIFCS